MLYTHKKKGGWESKDRIERTFWLEIKKMIFDGRQFSYSDIGDPFYKKFGFRASKDRMSKKSVFFKDGVAYFDKW